MIIFYCNCCLFASTIDAEPEGVPTPDLSKVFWELSISMLSFNGCFRIKLCEPIETS